MWCSGELQVHAGIECSRSYILSKSQGSVRPRDGVMQTFVWTGLLAKECNRTRRHIQSISRIARTYSVLVVRRKSVAVPNVLARCRTQCILILHTDLYVRQNDWCMVAVFCGVTPD